MAVSGSNVGPGCFVLNLGTNTPQDLGTQNLNRGYTTCEANFNDIRSKGTPVTIRRDYSATQLRCVLRIIDPIFGTRAHRILMILGGLRTRI